jgi:hypothetical protein
VRGSGDDLGGLAAHIAARVAAIADTREVFVSRTVTEVAGSGIEFMDRGEYELRWITATDSFVTLAFEGPLMFGGFVLLAKKALQRKRSRQAAVAAP